MALGARRLATLTAMLAVTAVLVPAALAVRGAQPEFPTLYVQYALNCTFTIVDDSGNTVTSIPPGTYQVTVTTPIMFSLVNTQALAPGSLTACKGYVQFQLTGPGVSLYTTLFQGCESFQVLSSAQFRPSSTYVAQDNNNPTVARVAFTTLASGSPVIPPSPQGPGTGKGTSSTDVVGSGLAAVRGTLAAVVSPAGKLTLTYKGKSVSTLEAGRYVFSVLDKSTKTGFFVQGIHGAATTVAGRAFVGKKSRTVTLKAGQWFFYPASGAAKSYFIVVR